MSIQQMRLRQEGMALVASLLLLVVMTILGVAMFRSYGFQQHIAGNTREKTLAFQNAMDAQRYAESWLTSNNGVHATNGSACTTMMSVSAGSTQVCSNLIQSDVQDVPWPSYVSYSPPNSSGLFQVPMFYISYLGSGPANGYQMTSGITYNLYQIDAAGYGQSSASVAVVESTYTVQTTKTSEPPPTGQAAITKNINLGGS
jgi:type IV pilus assembly protein PilX